MIEFFIFLFGAAWGSFLNVLIYRLPKHQGIRGRSRCPYCKKILRWYELIPIISFIIQKGRCRGCFKKISYQYIIIEVLTGALFLAAYLALKKNYPDYLNFSLSISSFKFLDTIYEILNTTYYFYIIAIFIAVALIDLKTFFIPDKLVLPAIIISFIYQFFSIFNPQKITHIKDGAADIFTLAYNILSAFIIFLFFFALYFFSRGRAMGLGDAKLGLLIGLFLPIPLNIGALMIAFVIGGIFGIILLALKKADRKTLVPFGPFMVLGAILALFFPEFITNIFPFFWTS